MIMAQRNYIVGITFRMIFLQLMDDKNRQPIRIKHLKWQTTKLQGAYNKQNIIVH